MFIASGFTFLCSHQGPQELTPIQFYFTKWKEQTHKKRCNWGLKPNEIKQEIKCNQGIKLNDSKNAAKAIWTNSGFQSKVGFFSAQLKRPNINNNRANRTVALLKRINCRESCFQARKDSSSSSTYCVAVVELATQATPCFSQTKKGSWWVCLAFWSPHMTLFMLTV